MNVEADTIEIGERVGGMFDAESAVTRRVREPSAH